MIDITVFQEDNPLVQNLLVKHHQLAAKEAQKYRGRLLGSDRNALRQVYVATVGESAIGSLVLRVDSASEWVIEMIHVVEVARGIGVGNKLMHRVLEDARAEGATRLTGAALPGDRSTKNLYERFGLIAETIVVSKDLTT